MHRGIQKSLLQPVHQWKAHETAIASIEGANFRGKLELLVTAGFDCYVHLWTVAGSHIGAFGQARNKQELSVVVDHGLLKLPRVTVPTILFQTGAVQLSAEPTQCNCFPLALQRNSLLQPNGPWSLGSRATWQGPREQAILTARERERYLAETLPVVDPDEQGSGSGSTRQDSRHLRRTVKSVRAD